MKKVILCLCLLLMPICVEAKESVNLYLFYGEGCPHCISEKNYLEELQTIYPDLNIIKYEVWHNDENNKLLTSVKTYLDSSARGVPYTVVGETGISGFSESLKESITNLIDKCSQTKCNDIMELLEEEKEEKESEIVVQKLDNQLNNNLILYAFLGLIVITFISIFTYKKKI